jgi:UDP-glucose 4-epimerase
MKRILLLGASGLIGSRVDLDLKNSYEIIRLTRSRADGELTGDLSRPDTIRALELPELYAVVHCAGVTDEDFRNRPGDAFIQSTLGMQAVIDKAIAAKANRFVYISTSHVYGRQAGVIDENTRPDPLSDYAIAHYAAEQTLQRNAPSFEAAFTLRPNAVFGEPVFIDKFDRWSLIPFSFPLEAVYTQKIVLRSSGEQNRNFVSTGDVSRYIAHLLEAEPGERFEVINAVGKETMSVYEFGRRCAEIYEKLTGDACIVQRPKNWTHSDDPTFEYRSKFDASLEKDDLASRTGHLMETVLKEYKDGKRFET